MRQWFVEQDLIEGVIYLPENLFYNTTAPGIILVPEQGQAEGAQGQTLPAQRQPASSPRATRRTTSPTTPSPRIADTFNAWQEEEKYSRIVTREEIAKNDYNISPSRYIHTGAAEEYRPIAEIVEELEALEAEARETDKALRHILERIAGLISDETSRKVVTKVCR